MKKCRGRRGRRKENGSRGKEDSKIPGCRHYHGDNDIGDIGDIGVSDIVDDEKSMKSIFTGLLWEGKQKG